MKVRIAIFPAYAQALLAAATKFGAAWYQDCMIIPHRQQQGWIVVLQQPKIGV